MLTGSAELLGMLWGGERDKSRAVSKPARAAAALAPALVLLQWSRAREAPALPMGSHPWGLDELLPRGGKAKPKKPQLQFRAGLGDPAAVPGAGSSLHIQQEPPKASPEGAAPGPRCFGSIPGTAGTGNGALWKHRSPKSTGGIY